MTEPIAFMTLARDPEVSRLRQQIEYLRAVYDDEQEGGEFIFGIDTRTDQQVVNLISTWPGAKIVPIEWEDDFSKARNQILRQAEAPWVAYFDPDELPNHALLWFIHETIRNEDKKLPLAYLFWFRSFFSGTNLRLPEAEADYHIRMFRPNHAEFVRPVHELVNIKGMAESVTRGRPEIVGKLPKTHFVIHAKPPGNVDEDSKMYDAIEKSKTAKVKK